MSFRVTVMLLVSPPQARRFGRGHHQAVDVGRLKAFAAAFAPSAVRVITPVFASIANQPLSLPDLRAGGHRFAVGVFGDRAQYAVCRTVLVVAEAVLTVGGAFKRRRVVICSLSLTVMSVVFLPRPAFDHQAVDVSKSWFFRRHLPNRKPAIVVTGLDAVQHRFAVSLATVPSTVTTVGGGKRRRVSSRFCSLT